MKRIAVFLLVLFGWCNPASADDIENFRSGLACLNPDLDIEGFGESGICHETKDIIITGQSSCTFDRKKVPCTWYGFEFSFSGRLAGKTLNCISENDEGISVGGPKGVETDEVITYEYDINLPKEAGRFFNPQFAVYSPRRQIPETTNEKTKCSLDGKKLFQFQFRFTYPAGDSFKLD